MYILYEIVIVMSKKKCRYGIVLQGLVNEYTRNIIDEYYSIFPDVEIILSTWNSENTDDISCKIIKSDSPNMSEPHRKTHNHQIIGTLAGLNNIDADIVLKCRTEQIIHNPQIFKLYENSCPPNKIMVPDLGTYENIEYRTSDFCQIASLKLLLDFWNSIPPYDGSFAIDGGAYFTTNYIKNAKKDKNPWKSIIHKYFLVKSYHSDFQIEWLKLNNLLTYQKNYYSFFPNCVRQKS